MRTIGFIVLLIGLDLTIFTAATFLSQDNVIELGSVEITRNEAIHLNWSSLLGLIVMSIGGMVLWSAFKKK